MSEKVAVVTGTNKGLAFAIVKGLCEKFTGTVYLTERNENSGLALVKKLNEIGLKPDFYKLDVTNRKNVEEFAKYIESKHGGLDVLVNNNSLFKWNEDYPTYEVARKVIEENYCSLLTIEECLYPLLRDGARVVNITNSCGHLSNVRNKKWREILQSPDLTAEDVNEFVNEYLESVKNGNFNKDDFADEGKHAEYKVAHVAVAAITFIQQRKYFSRNISINAAFPGPVNDDEDDGSAEVPLYLILEASPNLKGTFMWNNKKLVDWYDADGDYFCKELPLKSV